MKFFIAALSATIALTAPAFAEGDGDAGKGEKAFKKCKSCHTIASEDEVIVKGGKTGPNLYGLPGRAAGSQEGFKYSDLMKAANAKGLVWDEEHFVGFVQDPSGYLKEFTGESGRSKMTFKLRKEKDAHDIWAYFEKVNQKSE